jgi:hypothetical protein
MSRYVACYDIRSNSRRASDLFDFFPIDRRQPKRRLSWQRDPSPPDNVIVV